MPSKVTCSNCEKTNNDTLFTELEPGTEQAEMDRIAQEGGGWMFLQDGAVVCPSCCLNVYLNSAYAFIFVDPDYVGTICPRALYQLNRYFGVKEPSLKLQYHFENALAAIQTLEKALDSEKHEHSQ